MSSSYIYWINTLDTIKGALAIIVGVSLVLFTVRLIILFYTEEIEGPFTTINKKVLIGLALLGFIFCLIPSKRTLIEMKVAEIVTKENYNFAKEEIKGAIDYIFEKIDEVAK